MGQMLLHLQTSVNCTCSFCSTLDKNCDHKKCNLRLGSSCGFIEKVDRQKYHGTNYLKSIFASPNGRIIFMKNENLTKANYSNVYDGTKKTLVTFPPLPVYDSRIKPTATFFEPELERKVREGDFHDEGELKCIKKFLEKSMPQLGEGNILNGALTTFFHYRGLFVHGYEPNFHLRTFVEYAKQQRNQMKSSWETFTFSDLELNILQGMNIDVNTIHHQVNSLLQEMSQKTNASKILGALMVKTLEDAIEKEDGPKTALQNAKAKFKKSQESKYYSHTEIRNILTRCYYEDAVRTPGEYDFLLNLADFAMSVNIEVKRQLNTSRQENEYSNKSLRSASKQLSNHSDHYVRIMGPMISPQHQFIKIAAILPGQLDYSKICTHCAKFIITGETIEDIQGALQHICTRLTKMDNPFLDKQQSYQDYLNVFEAMVGFSHISLKQNVVSNCWKQIQGQQITIPLSAGWTKADKELTSTELRFEKVVDLPHDIFKLIYFNHDQLIVILNHPQFVIFASDYSAGKTLLLKEGATRLSERKQEQQELDEPCEETEGPEAITLQQKQNDTHTLDSTQDEKEVERTEAGILRSKEKAVVMEGETPQDTGSHGHFDILRLKASLVRNRMSKKFRDRKRRNDREEKSAKKGGKNETVTEGIEFRNHEEQIERMERRDSSFETSIGADTLVECDIKSYHPAIYSISLVATNPETGFPEKENYLFDVVSELELQGHDVMFMSTQDLQMLKHEKRGNKLVPSKVYGLVLSFIQANPGSSFFLDEVPILQKKDNFGIDRYGESSITEAERFIIGCKGFVKTGCSLWFALQANAMADLAVTKGHFHEKCRDMLQRLQDDIGFFVPRLSLNMRNSSNIAAVSKSVKSSACGGLKLSENVVDMLPTPSSSGNGRPPLFVPIPKDDFENKFQTTLKEAIESFSNKCIIIHTSMFSSKEIKKVLVNSCGIPQEQILCHDTFPNNSSKDQIKQYLKQPKDIIGVFNAKFVTGLEGCQIIYCSDEDDSNESIRCSITRAVADLIIIQRINNKSNFSPRFDHVMLEPKYLECQKSVESNALICETCRNDIICRSCAYACHKGHSFKDFINSKKSKLKTKMCQCGTNCQIKVNRPESQNPNAWKSIDQDQLNEWNKLLPKTF